MFLYSSGLLYTSSEMGFSMEGANWETSSINQLSKPNNFNKKTYKFTIIFTFLESSKWNDTFLLFEVSSIKNTRFFFYFPRMLKHTVLSP